MVLIRSIDLPRQEQPWRTAIKVAAQLHEAGHQAVLVGGCLRDLLLGQAVHDCDLATDAAPEQVAALFPGSVLVGARFGVVVVPWVESGCAVRQVEVASFRNDGAYIDGRRPVAVKSASEAQDVQRRDFTINALVYDLTTGQLRDHVGGLADLEARILRVVGVACERLEEDRLRVLRGLRFAATLDMTIEAQTWQALCSVGLAGLSRERIWDEWGKALAHPRRSAWWQLLGQAALRGSLWPELAEVEGHALARLGEGADSDLALATVLAEAPAQADPRPWLRGEPISRSRRELLAWLWQQRDPRQAWEAASAAGRVRLLRHAGIGLLQALWRCRSPDWPGHALVASALAKEQGRDRRPLLVAADLLALGLRPGPAIGTLLREADDLQLADDLRDREQALRWLQERGQSLVDGSGPAGKVVDQGSQQRSSRSD